MNGRPGRVHQPSAAQIVFPIKMGERVKDEYRWQKEGPRSFHAVFEGYQEEKTRQNPRAEKIGISRLQKKRRRYLGHMEAKAEALQKKAKQDKTMTPEEHFSLPENELEKIKKSRQGIDAEADFRQKGGHGIRFPKRDWRRPSILSQSPFSKAPRSSSPLCSKKD